MWKESVYIKVDGQPIAKPRMTRRDKWASRPCVLRYWAWKDKALARLYKMGGHPEGLIPYWVDVFAVIEPPKSWSLKKKKEALEFGYHSGKPDIDNIYKGVLDALIPEDKTVSYGVMHKMWGANPHTRVTIKYRLPTSWELK